MPEKSIGNLNEYSVTEISTAVKKSIEENFGLVRVRGELGRISRPASGHVYVDLKDERSVLAGVMWKGVASRLSIQPEQGMEVIATGRMTTFAGQSKYQLVIDSMEPAGVGALMALLEERKKKLSAEGLFAEDRKKSLPYLPAVIGVVTSPSGAVIRDIMHRLRDRFPIHVLVWPTAVQGQGAAEKIAGAINGFNAIGEGDHVSRPDVIIVARGGGSLEDLWCFNEEIVVRAAAESVIPIISGVGHETDTTLIDYAADRRAPTPTAAAELAVPVRSEILAEIRNKERRLINQILRIREAKTALLSSAARALGRPDDILGAASQNLDRLTEELRNRMSNIVNGAALTAARASARLAPNTLLSLIERNQHAVGLAFTKISTRVQNDNQTFEKRIDSIGRVLRAVSYENVLARGFALVRNSQGQIVRGLSKAPNSGPGEIQYLDGVQPISFGEKPGGKSSKKSAPAPKARQGGLFD
ncbi:MAG: exodeoxyribonuclease VII large subunit [Marinicaulis sp.]|nr:exodeoxyribonuclease VII large subunit [Marinicaulis sp.]